MAEAFSETTSASTALTPDAPDATSLGALLDEFGPNASLLATLRVFGAALLVGALLLWWAAHAGHAGHTGLPGTPPGQMPFDVLPLIENALALLCALSALFLWWKTLTWRTVSARLFEHGVVITRASDLGHATPPHPSRITTVRWEEIGSLTQRITRVRLRRRKPWLQPSLWEWHRYELTLTTGETVHLHNAYDRVAQLGKAIDMRSVEALLPAALAAYERGAIQTFGRLKISRMGLSDGHEWMPWNEFRHIGIFEGVLTIDRQGLRRPWVTTSLAQVPNAYLLIALVSKIPRNIR